jgi:hypothetical protein
MDYRRHYEMLMERARSRVLTGYSERHHILPKCMGGDNSAGNIVRLTPEEHYVAHQFLVKMFPGDRKILWAASNMTGASRRQPGRKNKLYGWLRRRLAESTRKWSTGRKHTAEARAKMSAARAGVPRGPHSQQTKDKMSATAMGRLKSEAHRAAMIAARTGVPRGPHSEEHKRKLSESNKRAAALRDKSIYQTEEYRASQAEKARFAWASRKAVATI